MKTSSMILIASFVIGILIISVLVIKNPPKNSVVVDVFEPNPKSRMQQYWGDYTGSNPNLIIIKETRKIEQHPIPLGDPRIEINGLKSEYSKDTPINFEVLVIGDGSGCASIWMSIFTEVETQPPIYSQEFVSICDGSQLKYLSIPIYFSINTEYGPVPHLDSGKYVVSASYYQDRGSSGDTKQGFIIK
ncbi:MAG: hypothetical protein WD018_06775 [Nitrosopumilaceae archaeon]